MGTRQCPKDYTSAGTYLDLKGENRFSPGSPSLPLANVSSQQPGTYNMRKMEIVKGSMTSTKTLKGFNSRPF